MNRRLLLPSLAILLLVAETDATLRQRLSRRQSSEDDSAPESTTASSSGSQSQAASTQSPPRLYPDLPRPATVAFVPPFNAANNPNGQAPFVPFGIQPPMSHNGRFGDPPIRGPMAPRPMTTFERLQSQTFTSGLGRRLLSLMGISPSVKNETSPTDESAPTRPSGPQMNLDNHNGMEDTMKALRNSTVLRQLNSGVQSIYGSLSRMYNSTVQQQLDLLQERYKKEAANSTDPWQQRMAQQVPQFFRSMAMKVQEAQDNLNRVWRQVAEAGNDTAHDNNGVGVALGATSQPQTMGTRSSSNPFDQMMGDGGGFLNHIGRSFGFGADPAIDDPVNSPRQDLGSRLMNFWHYQVQPQVGLVRGQVMRIWRDLTSSGALRPSNGMGMGRGGRGRGSDMGSNNDTNKTTDIVDDVLKEIEPEFKLVDPKSGNEQPQPSGMSPLMPRVQNGVVSMQRELNQLWNGLTNSIQNALGMMSARRSGTNDSGGADSNPEMDPAENEISDRLKDLSKLQKDADVVYDTVQRQQQQQQRPSFSDRFRNFLGNIGDFGNMDQLGNRFGESLFGNMWN